MSGNEFGGTTTIPTLVPPATPAPGAPVVPSFIDNVPQEFRDAAWIQDYAKNEKPYEALVKDYANARTLIGKKSTGVELPGDNAMPEAIAAFHKAIGVPENVDGYDYKGPDISKEPEAIQNVLKEMGKDDSFIKTMKAEALKAGITPKQFNALASVFDTRQLEQVRATMANGQSANEARIQTQTETFTKLYGDNVDTVKRIGSETFNKVVSQGARDSKDAEIMLFDALNFIHQKLYKNDTIANGNNAHIPQAQSRDQIHTKIMELRKTDAFRDFRHPQHGAMNKQINDLYKLMHAPKEE